MAISFFFSINIANPDSSTRTSFFLISVAFHFKSQIVFRCTLLRSKYRKQNQILTFVVVGPRSHPTIGIIILSDYSLPSSWQWRSRWGLWRLSLLLKKRQQAAQRKVGCGKRLRKSGPPDSTLQILWLLTGGLGFLSHQIFLRQKGLFTTTICQVPGSIVACVRDVFNWAWKCCFGFPRSHLQLRSSPIRMIRWNLAGRMMGTWAGLMNGSLDAGEICRRERT